MAMTLLQLVGLVSQNAVTENIELYSRKDGHEAVAAGRVVLSLL